MTKVSWRVNEFSAAVCVTTEEINRKLAEVFRDTNDLPKSWKENEKPAKEKAKPRWYIDVTFGAPTVDFATDLKDGLRLSVPITGGTFKHMSVEVDEENNATVTWPEFSLAGAVLMIETNMKSVEHETVGMIASVDTTFTVQSLCADMQSPNLLSKILTSGAKDFTAPDSTKLTIAGVLMGLVKSPRYANQWVIGRANIPTVSRTSGPLRPTGVRFSTFQETTGKKRGCVNWNLALNLEALPSKDNAKAGAFSAYPIPSDPKGNAKDDPKGVLVVSWLTVIKSIIAANALSPFGLKADEFNFLEAERKGALAKHVAWKLHSTVPDDKKQIDGKYTEVTILPDVGKSGVQVNFKLSNVVQHPSKKEYRDWQAARGAPGLSTNPGLAFGSAVGSQPSATDPRTLTWSSWFVFSLDDKQQLKVSHSAGDTSSSGEGPTGARVALSIISFGLNELTHHFSVGEMEKTMKTAFSAATLFADVLKTVELPGKAVFKFSAVQATDDGLVFSLKYA